MLYDLAREISTRAKDVDKACIDNTIDIIRGESLACVKCGALSVPLFGTRNVYRCLGCARQLTSVPHDIRTRLTVITPKSSVKSDYYNKAIDRLTLTVYSAKLADPHPVATHC